VQSCAFSREAKTGQKARLLHHRCNDPVRRIDLEVRRLECQGCLYRGDCSGYKHILASLERSSQLTCLGFHFWLEKMDLLDDLLPILQPLARL
jgi:hypothetical protein